MIKAACLSHSVIPTLQFAQLNQPHTQFAAVESPQTETDEMSDFTFMECYLLVDFFLVIALSKYLPLSSSSVAAVCYPLPPDAVICVFRKNSIYNGFIVLVFDEEDSTQK